MSGMTGMTEMSYGKTHTLSVSRCVYINNQNLGNLAGMTQGQTANLAGMTQGQTANTEL